MDRRIILVRYGEIGLKGLNRPVFEEKLRRNIKKSLLGLGKINVWRSQARTYITPEDDGFDIDEAILRLTKVFGIVSVSEVWKVETDLESIKRKALELAKEKENIKGSKTFKVETKRGDKNFPHTSPEVSAEVGAHILAHTHSLSVDVKNPDFILYVEVRESSYIYTKIIPSVGGMPLGSNGKALLLLSGGIDSPAAGWMVAKRGVEIDAIHFYSYPYTSERAKDKVIELCRIMSEYCVEINLHIVHFTDIQLAIHENSPEDQTTILMRRVMMRMADMLAEKTGAKALVTGESIGQVASQTLESLAVTNEAAKLQVIRPLIGMDKNEIIEIARKIGTFETSILPYEDCCTVFVPKHPKTKPRLENIKLLESHLDLEGLIAKAMDNLEIIRITRSE